MSQPALSPSLTLLDSEPTHEQPESLATAPSDHSDETGITHRDSSSVTAPSDHSDDTDNTASTQEEPSSPITAPSDHSDGTSDAAESKASTSEAKTKESRPLSKVQELAAWYDSQANGNLRLQVLTCDGRVVDAPKNKTKKSKKTLQAEQGLM